MLDTIKNIINQKEEFRESAQIIYEDAIDDIENYITESDDLEIDEDDTPTNPEVDTDDVKQDDDDEPNGELGAAVEDKDDDDIFDMSIDITTNTLTDVLPVPPMNASDAVTDNLMNMNIGDGFDENSDLLEMDMSDGIDEINESSVLAMSNREFQELLRKHEDDSSPMSDIKYKLMHGSRLTPREAAFLRMQYQKNDKEKDVGYILMQNYKGNKLPSNILTEAINIDATADDEKPANNDVPADEPATTTDEPNDVTNAVIDKVNDVESEPEEDTDAKGKLMDKLDKLSRNILDLKENIKKNMA